MRLVTINGGEKDNAIANFCEAKILVVKEQEQQGKRLTALESRDGEMWRKVVTYAITAAVGIIVGFAAKQIGM